MKCCCLLLLVNALIYNARQEGRTGTAIDVMGPADFSAENKAPARHGESGTDNLFAPVCSVVHTAASSRFSVARGAGPGGDGGSLGSAAPMARCVDASGACSSGIRVLTDCWHSPISGLDRKSRPSRTQQCRSFSTPRATPSCMSLSIFDQSSLRRAGLMRGNGRVCVLQGWLSQWRK